MNWSTYTHSTTTRIKYSLARKNKATPPSIYLEKTSLQWACCYCQIACRYFLASFLIYVLPVLRLCTSVLTYTHVWGRRQKSNDFGNNFKNESFPIRSTLGVGLLSHYSNGYWYTMAVLLTGVSLYSAGSCSQVNEWSSKRPIIPER